MSEAVEAGAPPPLVLLHDGAGIPVAEPMLIRQPVSPLLTAQEGWPGFETGEPLRKVAAGDGRDARDQVSVRLLGVVHRQRAPPGAGRSCCRDCPTAGRLATPGFCPALA